MASLLLAGFPFWSSAEAYEGRNVYSFNLEYQSGAHAGSFGSGQYETEGFSSDAGGSLIITEVNLLAFSMTVTDPTGPISRDFTLSDVTVFDPAGMYDNVFNTLGVAAISGSDFSLEGGAFEGRTDPFLARVTLPEGEVVFRVSYYFSPAIPEPTSTLAVAGGLLCLWGGWRRWARR